MVNPQGLDPHSTRPVAVRGTHGAYEMVTLNDDREYPRIELWKVTPAEFDEDGKEIKPRCAIHACDLPPVLGRYTRGDGLIYKLGTSWDEAATATAEDLRAGRSWAKIDATVPKWAFEAAYLATQQAGQIHYPKPLGISPSIEKGLPPLAPELTPTGDDPEAGRQAVTELGRRAGPKGRWIVGAMLSSPWVRAVGALPTIVAVVGTRGFGKTATGQLGAAMFGSIDEKVGLVRQFDASAMGLQAWWQELSYLPCLMDEIKTAKQGDAVGHLSKLAGGASRSRSGKDGVSEKNPANWRGVATVTANKSVRDMIKFSADPEPFDRRLIETDTAGLWDAPLKHEDPTAYRAWWRETHRLIKLAEGWAWAELQRQFPPGTAGALRYVDRFNELPVLPGADSIDTIATLAYRGCEWLAEWTGDPIWTEGVWDVAVQLAAETMEAGTDPAREAAEQILEDKFTRRDAWSGEGRERVVVDSAFETGAPTPVCGIPHADSDTCWWVDIPGSAFRSIVTHSPSRLGATEFVKALYRHQGKGLTRPAPRRADMPRIRVYTLCLHALGVLGYEADAPEEPTLPTGPSSGPVEQQLEIPTAPEQVDQEPAAEVARSAVYAGYAWSDAGHALECAAAEGVTDLTGPATWRVSDLTGAGWEVPTWAREGDQFGGVVAKNGYKIRVRTDDDPEAYARALHSFHDLTGRGVGASVPGLSLRLLLEAHESVKARAGRTRTPLWRLPDEVEQMWTGAYANPKVWGSKQAGHTGWDRNASYLPAYTQAKIAPLYMGEHGREEYRRVTGDQIPEVDGNWAGMWRITVPSWPWPELPSPVSSIEPGQERWVSTEIMALYKERDIHPTIHEAVLAPAHRPGALTEWKKTLHGWWDATGARVSNPDGSLTVEPTEHGPAAMIVKRLWASLHGRVASEHSKSGQWTIYRPDWSRAFQDNSWCSTLRRAYALYDEHGWAPSAVYTDALYYPSNEIPPGWDVPNERTGRAVIGTEPGQFKREGTVPGEVDQEPTTTATNGTARAEVARPAELDEPDPFALELLS